MRCWSSGHMCTALNKKGIWRWRGGEDYFGWPNGHVLRVPNTTIQRNAEYRTSCCTVDLLHTPQQKSFSVKSALQSGFEKTHARMQLQKRATYVTHSIIYVGEKTQLHTLMLILGSNSQRVKSSCQYEKSNEKENRTEGVILATVLVGAEGWLKKKKKKERRKKRGGCGRVEVRLTC